MAKRTHEQQIQGFFIYMYSLEKKPHFMCSCVHKCSEMVGSGRVGWKNSIQFLSEPDCDADFLEKREAYTKNGILTEGDQLLEKESFPLKKNGFPNIIQKITFNTLKGFPDDGKSGCQPVLK